MPNPYVVSLDQHELKTKTYYRRGSALPQHQRISRPREGYRRVYVPRREEVVEVLAQEGMLPAIYFVFSRSGCERSVRWLRDAGRPPHDAGRRPRTIRERAEMRAAWVDEEDLTSLGFSEFLESLTTGVAAHHAGMLPMFKETVEELFEEGLVKVVFATETLSLGINMPAKSVVIEDLWKFQGERHELLTPGGVHAAHGAGRTAGDRRAGPRRGRVPAAGAVRAGGGARRHPHVRPRVVVPALVQHGGEPRPQLHARAGASPPELVLRAVPGRPRRRGAGAVPAAATWPRWRATGRTWCATSGTSRSTGGSSRRRGGSGRTTGGPATRGGATTSVPGVAGLRPGDVVWVPRARRRGLAVVVSSRDGKPTVLAQDRQFFRLSARDFEEPPSVADADPAAAVRERPQRAVPPRRRGAPRRARREDRRRPAPRADDPKVEREAARLEALAESHPCRAVPRAGEARAMGGRGRRSSSAGSAAWNAGSGSEPRRSRGSSTGSWRCSSARSTSRTGSSRRRGGC